MPTGLVCYRARRPTSLTQAKAMSLYTLPPAVFNHIKRRRAYSELSNTTSFMGFNGLFAVWVLPEMSITFEAL